MPHLSIHAHLFPRSSHHCHESAPATDDRCRTNQNDCGPSDETNRGAQSCALEAWSKNCNGNKPGVPQRQAEDVTFDDPYKNLNAANYLNNSRGFEAARGKYLQSIREADGISMNQLVDEHRDDMRKLYRIDSRAAEIEKNGGSWGCTSDLEGLDNARQQVLRNEEQLHRLYYAPATTRVDMGLAAIRTGDPLEMSDGQRLIDEAISKRPEIARDPHLRQLVDSAYEDGCRLLKPSPFGAHADIGTPAPFAPGLSPRAENPPPVPEVIAPQPLRQLSCAPGTAPLHAPETNVRPIGPRNAVRPIEPEIAARPMQLPQSTLPPIPIDVRPSHAPANTVRPGRPPDITARPFNVPEQAALQPVQAADGQTADSQVDDSQMRIGDSLALNWLHGKYKHLSNEARQANEQDAQKAHDSTESSVRSALDLNTPSWEQRANSNKQDTLFEFAQGYRNDLKDLFNTAKQPRSYDSENARHALTAIIKTSAQGMGNEANCRSIAQESCACVKDLCAPGSPGRLEIVDAIRAGLTQSESLPSGAKNYLIDGLDLLTTGQPPAISREDAGRIALKALTHECESMGRLPGGGPHPGQSSEDSQNQQIRLIGLLAKYGATAAAGDLQVIAIGHPSEQVRQAALQAGQQLESDQYR